jgi:hypothetical protein
MKDVWGFPMETKAIVVKVPNTIVATEEEKNLY